MSRFWAGHPELSGELEQVRQTILNQAARDEPSVGAAIDQLLASSGKMLRPAFVLLASRFGSPDRDRMVRIAAAVEMLHMATLVHDDIIDAAPLRRGVASLQALRGPRTAVLVGDWLFASCFSMIADLATDQSGRALSHLVARICGSEIRQAADKYVLHTSVRRYLRRIAGKTAALFALAFHVGAEESGCSKELVSVLRRLGYSLGMGFQIIDDILDITRDGAETGKRSGSDLSQGIFTLPVVIALKCDDGRLAAALSRGQYSRRAALRATRIVLAGNGVAGARAAAEAYTDRAIRSIDRLPPQPARETLREVTTRLLSRTY
ncbi:MAG: polyprenyl synthetase family protein [Spirochaetia bacterium]